jgi:hypothetical protein
LASFVAFVVSTLHRQRRRGRRRRILGTSPRMTTSALDADRL